MSSTTRQGAGRRLASIRARCAGLIAASLVVGLLAACTTAAPQLRLHSLLDSKAEFGAAGVSAAADAAAIRLTIAPIKLPAAIDQPQWLIRRADDSLQLLEQDRWASPLADELRSALRARLAARWGVTDANLPVAASADPASWRLLLEVLRLDARPGIETSLDARWTLMAPQIDAARVTCSLRIVEPVNGEGTLPIAAAHRRSVLSLADRIGAQLLRSNQRDGVRVPTCGEGALS